MKIKKSRSSVIPMNSIRKLFLRSETYCSNNWHILNDFDIVRLGSIGFENRTQSIFLVRLRSTSVPIEPSRSTKFDLVRLSSISEQFDWSRRAYIGYKHDWLVHFILEKRVGY